MRLGRAVLAAAWLVAASRAPAAPPADPNWQEVARGQVDTKALTPRGQTALDMPGLKWRHAHTPHFVVHFEQEIFARKVGRMAEFFYGYIGADLEGATDRLEGRSHIFIFRTQKDWKAFGASAGDVPEWSFSQVAGPVMFLQQAADTSSSGDVLAHEMAHLVVNRFLERPPPLWLNEGLAEFYEEFAYSAFKGIKKSRRSQFRRLNRVFPVASLLEASAYPNDTASVHAFYETSKYLVGWLRLDRPADRFVPFVADLAAGQGYQAVFAARYGLNSVAAIEAEFLKFAR
ncbi:MAG TPA: hypothetical protein P5567_03840 [Kiritimatiellia bacterium]|nr:hypothetical protein [Kiritimatiellia bacterium]HRZ11568.1 hypothetical protein [Kiritimatiellia bacterium]HSA16881.1 hypothetical protein [Kiritimatiellia bacterium]